MQRGMQHAIPIRDEWLPWPSFPRRFHGDHRFHGGIFFGAPLVHGYQGRKLRMATSPGSRDRQPMLVAALSLVPRLVTGTHSPA
jgi:hypothetical protein